YRLLLVRSLHDHPLSVAHVFDDSPALIALCARKRPLPDGRRLGFAGKAVARAEGLATIRAPPEDRRYFTVYRFYVRNDLWLKLYGHGSASDTSCVYRIYYNMHSAVSG